MTQPFAPSCRPSSDERDKLNAEVSLPKFNTQVFVDRRPLCVRVAGAAISLPETMYGRHEQFTPSERETLQKAVSADQIEKHGLREGTHGEIANERDQTVFDIGFARAIRKVFGN
jgi:hypothetical protein